MTYNEAEQYLLEQLPMFQRIGAAAYKADLTNITALCHYLGNPQQSLRCIHVAGTNGKGSVTHIIAAILQAAGYTVGTFVSPHYKTYRERIKINGSYIEQDYITGFVTEHKPYFETSGASFFEITTAMMFAYFKHKKADYCIIETGLGGRLDSTNIIAPLLSVITNISFDHIQFLGGTLPLIAAEKAGIIKPGTPVVIGETQTDTSKVFTDKARAENAYITFADQHVQTRLYRHTALAYAADIALEGEAWLQEVHTDLAAAYQAKNITTALAAILQLRPAGLNITDSHIREGLGHVAELTAFTGRWMVKQQHPAVIFDSAHNEGGIRELNAQLALLSYKRLHFVYGSVADKDLAAILALLPGQATYYFCKPDIPRGKDAAALQQEAARLNLKGNAYHSVAAAYEAALSNASTEDCVLVAGSIFVVAEVL
jgi:dihydrofolate synthase/folylpolyglutamate synthase